MKPIEVTFYECMGPATEKTWQDFPELHHLGKEAFGKIISRYSVHLIGEANSNDAQQVNQTHS